MNGTSLDIREDRLKKLQQLFPELFAENRLDWEKLKASFGDQINFENERYTLNWAGKADAFRILQQPAIATLRPAPQDSLHFHSSQHVFIEGENLEVLKTLQKSYFSSIKCIIIDPPYNTGGDSFIYPDNFRESKTDYEKRVGDRDEEGFRRKEHRFRKNMRENGHFHSNWLNMIYPRLFLARNLLKEDGTIFVHIDDNEAHNLRLLMNEIFGEENFIGCFCWRKKAGAGADSRYFFRQHEYVLSYAKNITRINALFQPLTEKQRLEYKNPDNDLRGSWAPTDLKRAGDNDPKRIYVVTSPAGTQFEACWSYTRENFKQLEANNLIWWGKSNNSEPKRKRFLHDKQGLTPRSWIDNFLTADGTKDLEKLQLETVFDYPKPVGLVKQLLQIGADKDAVIMDFFGGSGTTAQAVLELNREDNGHRKFIIVQLPETIEQAAPAYAAGYRTIADISRERIRKSIQKMSQESAAQQQLFSNYNPEEGFKAFTLAPSNFKTWNSDALTEENIVQQLEMFTNPLQQDASQESMLYELMLKSGYPLTETIQRHNNYYAIDNGRLVIVLEHIDSSSIAAIIAAAPEKVMVLDLLFAGNDELKTNTALQMQDAGIDFKTI